MTDRLTVAQLKKWDACANQVKVFARLFPEGATPTLVNLRRAAKAGLDLDWYARKALSPTALQAYEEATAQAWKAYEEAKAPAWKAYEEAKAPAWKAYEEAKAPALQAYEEATAQAWKAYEEAKAQAWRNAIKQDKR